MLSDNFSCSVKMRHVPPLRISDAIKIGARLYGISEILRLLTAVRRFYFFTVNRSRVR